MLQQQRLNRMRPGFIREGRVQLSCHTGLDASPTPAPVAGREKKCTVSFTITENA